MEYRYLIFDFDGTLVDTAELIVETMQRTISALSLPEKTEDECRAMIGYRLEEIPGRLWPEHPEISEHYVLTYHEFFNSLKVRFKVNLYPGVIQTLATLHNADIRMAIASSRSRASLEEYTDELGISEFFVQLVGGDDVTEGKPSPEPVKTILSQQGWDPKKTLVVGDMNVDILMGNRAGTDTCGVTYGNGTSAELRAASATHILSAFPQLLTL